MPESVRQAIETVPMLRHAAIGAVISSAAINLAIVRLIGLFLMWPPARRLVIRTSILKIRLLPVVVTWGIQRARSQLLAHSELHLDGTITTLCIVWVFEGQITRAAWPHAIIGVRHTPNGTSKGQLGNSETTNGSASA